MPDRRRILSTLAGAKDLFEEPPLPRHRLIDEGRSKTITFRSDRGDRMMCLVHDIGDENVAYLKSLIANEFEPDDDPNICFQHERRAQDAKKTLAEIEAWHAEAKRRRELIRLDEAEEAYEATTTAISAHRAAMLAITATSFRELAFQAALLEDDWQQDDVELVLKRLIELAGVMPRNLITTAV